jgi:cyclophilin family peptidyl-prolyl cis-trans isomerase/HEAT repeat protein
MTKYFPLVWIAVLLLCCETRRQSINKFSDPVFIKIANFQDRRLADSLYPYFSHSNAAYRSQAVRAFASLQKGDVDKIGKLLLMDPEGSVRRAAALALGQIAHPACERILLGALMKEKTPDISFEILDAYGKTTRQWKLDPRTFLNDSVKSAGLAWSLYRAALRGKTDSVVNGVAIGLLDQKYSVNTRLAAAHFFARGATQFHKQQEKLIEAAVKDVSPEVRMATVLALGKIFSDRCLTGLKHIMENENDSRVVINCIRALRSFPSGITKPYLYQALNHKDVNVGIAASEVIIETALAGDWIEVSSLTNQIQNLRIRANLYEAALKAGQNKDLASEIMAMYETAQSPSERAAWLSSLKNYPLAYRYVEQELRTEGTELVRSAAAATLVGMNRSSHFTKNLLLHFAKIYTDIVGSDEDPAVLGSIATALMDSTLGYRDILKNPDFLYAAKSKLKLPAHYESLQLVEAAIAYFERRPVVSIKNEFNHPINWDLVKSIREDQSVIIKTNRGNITIRLFVNESPGSVANFIELAQKNYFDNKFFHRVVPNFVIQDGCKRGDGWGSEDYSIRSEFSGRRYQAGSVGMASAGKDTEGTQWFITHSPTPHLDGRYTLFGEVTEGMKVVNYIQVGDKITDVVLEDFPPR